MNIPHSERYEKSVISTLMKEGFVLEGAESLTPEHFYMGNMRRIFNAIAESTSEWFDLTEFVQQAMDGNFLDDLGGPSAVTEAYTFAPSAAHFESHVKHLHSYKARRIALKAGMRLTESAQDLSDEEGFIDAAGEPMSNVLEVASANKAAKSKKQIIKDAMLSFKDRIENEGGAMGWRTGLQSYDAFLKGLHPQQVTVLSGFPSSGKTVLAGQLLWSLAQDGVPTLMISLEMPADKIIERIIPLAGHIPAMAVSDPLSYARQEGGIRPTKGQLDDVRRGFVRVQDAPFEIEDPSNASIAQILATIRRHHRKNKIKAVAIDYLQLIRGKGSLSREQQMSEISHALQGIAKELKVSMILLSQQNKEGGTKHAESIAEDADVVLSILQDRDRESEHYGKHQGIMIRKDRHHGNTGEVMPIYFEKPMLRFSQDLKMVGHT